MLLFPAIFLKGIVALSQATSLCGIIFHKFIRIVYISQSNLMRSCFKLLNIKHLSSFLCMGGKYETIPPKRAQKILTRAERAVNHLPVTRD